MAYNYSGVNFRFCSLVIISKNLEFIIEMKCCVYYKYNLKLNFVHYIYHKNEKGKLSKKDSLLFKNDITRTFLGIKRVL